MSDFKVKYTNKDIIEKIGGVHDELVRLNEHVNIQNGRIGKVEKSISTLHKVFGAGFVTLVGWILAILLKS